MNVIEIPDRLDQWWPTTTIDNNYRHRYYPGYSWCPYKHSDNKIDQNDCFPYKSSQVDPKIIKAIFVDLSGHVLSKFLNGSTQNVDKALNQIIWNKWPKKVFLEKKTLEINVY